MTRQYWCGVSRQVKSKQAAGRQSLLKFICSFVFRGYGLATEPVRETAVARPEAAQYLMCLMLPGMELGCEGVWNSGHKRHCNFCVHHHKSIFPYPITAKTNTVKGWIHFSEDHNPPPSVILGSNNIWIVKLFYPIHMWGALTGSELSTD